MDISTPLRFDHDQLKLLYFENLELLSDFQTKLREQILPNVVDELELNDEDTRMANAWLTDVGSIFRMLKRHRFTCSFALETMRTTLLWRITNLPVIPSTYGPADLLYCLPPPAHDVLDRPILILRPASLNDFSDSIKDYLLYVIENLRAHLQDINSSLRDCSEYPVLQYIIIIDMTNVSLRSMNVDLLGWYIREIVPRFPGLLGAVFMINYTWTHAGLWNFAKRVLPENALSKVFFPSMEALYDVVPLSSLPQDYGGRLPLLKDLPNILGVPANPSSPAVPPRTDSDYPPRYSHPKPAAATQISPRSRYNPFFGYPVMPTSSRSGSFVPHLHHGRQRKRDLVRTLAVLWWERWKTSITLSLLLLLASCIVGIANRRRHLTR